MKSPIFSLDSFRNCLGPIIFGHVHIPGCFNQYMYSCGSPIRWRFGEEEEKGFFIVVQNLDTREHYAHFETIQSFRYDTINLDSMLNDDPKRVIDYIKSLQMQGIDYIRIEFGRVTDDQLANLEIIRNFYANSKKVKLKIDTTDKSAVLRNNEDFINKYKDYEYIFDPNLSEFDILSMYINQNKGYTYITAEELKNILEEEI